MSAGSVFASCLQDKVVKVEVSEAVGAVVTNNICALTVCSEVRPGFRGLVLNL